MKKGSLNLTVLLLVFTLIQLTALPLSAGQENGIYGDQITFISGQTAGDPALEGSRVVEVIAEGNALIIYNEIEISAGHIKYMTATEDVFLRDVVFINPDYRIEGETMTGNLERKDFLLEGGVRLTGPEILITAPRLNYQMEPEKADFEGGVNLEYQGISARAERVTYNPSEDTALLEGDVEGERDGYHFSGNKLLIDLAKEDIILKGDGSRARMLFSGEEREE